MKGREALGCLIFSNATYILQQNLTKSVQTTHAYIYSNFFQLSLVVDSFQIGLYENKVLHAYIYICLTFPEHWPIFQEHFGDNIFDCLLYRDNPR